PLSALGLHLGAGGLHVRASGLDLGVSGLDRRAALLLAPTRQPAGLGQWNRAIARLQRVAGFSRDRVGGDRVAALPGASLRARVWSDGRRRQRLIAQRAVPELNSEGRPRSPACPLP